MSSKSQTSFFFIKSQKQNNQKNIIIIHFFKKKTKQYFLKIKNKLPEEVAESSSENLKGHPKEPFFQNSSGRILLPEFFRKNYFFRKLSGRGVPGDFRKKGSSRWPLVSSGRTLLPECFRNNFFQKFQKNPYRIFWKPFDF